MAQETKNFFNWEPKYSLEVNQMDNEHKQLILYMNQLFELNEKKAAFPLIEAKLNDLYRYTESHFRNEEQFFTSLPYAKAQAHKNIHKELLSRLVEHATQIKAQRKVSDAFFTFLKVWLSAHILGIDKGYAAVHKSGAA